MGRIDIIITPKLVVNEAEDYCVSLYIQLCIQTLMHSCMHEYTVECTDAHSNLLLH